MALAFLNEYNDASYDFYKIYPQKRLDIEFPSLQQDDIVLFGSFYAITPEVRKKLIRFIEEAKKKKAIGRICAETLRRMMDATQAGMTTRELDEIGP